MGPHSIFRPRKLLKNKDPVKGGVVFVGVALFAVPFINFPQKKRSKPRRAITRLLGRQNGPKVLRHERQDGKENKTMKDEKEEEEEQGLSEGAENEDAEGDNSDWSNDDDDDEGYDRCVYSCLKSHLHKDGQYDSAIHFDSCYEEEGGEEEDDGPGDDKHEIGEHGTEDDITGRIAQNDSKTKVEDAPTLARNVSKCSTCAPMTNITTALRVSSHIGLAVGLGRRSLGIGTSCERLDLDV